LLTGFIKGGITVDDINDDDVKDILKSLQIGKASGGDFISHQMLKNTADTVYLPLKYIFNHSLRISKFGGSILFAVEDIEQK
jgi:hypothetical protein